MISILRKQLLVSVLITQVLGLCSAVSRAQDSGASQPIVIGYPHDGKPVPPSDLKSIEDLNQAWRICSFSHRGMTPESADEVAKRYAAAGFNLMISEGNRYLLWDKEKAAPKAHNLITHGQSFEDTLRDTRLMSDACHKYGMKFFLHLTSTMVDATLLEEHPEWAAIDMATGTSPTNSYGTANTCFVNKAFMKEFYERLERLIRETRPDGIMLDEIQFFGYSLCGCPSCRAEFRRDTRLSLPATSEWSEWVNTPAWRRWQDWRREKVIEESKKYRDLFKSINPEGIVSFYQCNPTTGYSFATAGMTLDNLLQFADSVGYECEPHDFLYGYYWPHMIYEMKYQRAIAENVGSAPWALFYNTSTRPGDFVLNWLLAMSQGNRHWWLTEDRKYDRSWAFEVAWEAEHEKLTMNQISAANIGVLFSLPSRDRSSTGYGEKKREWIHGYAGTCNALTFGHVPFKAIVEADLTSEALSRKLNTLVLFNTTHLSNAEVKAVRDFVRNGGTLIASGDVSRFDKQGKARPDYGLASVLGVRYAGEYSEQNSFVPKEGAEKLLGITGPIPHNYPFNLVKNVAKDVKILATMQTADGKTHPGLLARKFGEGRVLYFTGHPELSYFFHYYNTNVLKPGESWTDERDPSWGEVVCRAVQLGNAEVPMIVENLPRGVVAEVYRQQYGDLKGVQVMLANFLGGNVKEGVIPPLGDVSFPSVKDHQPDPSKPIHIAVRADDVKKVYVMSPDFEEVVELPFRAEKGLVHVDLPEMHRYAMLYFSQGSDAEILKIAGGKTVQNIPPARELLKDTWPPAGQ